MGKEEEHSDDEHDEGTKNEEPTSRLSSTTSRPTSRPLSTAGLVSSNKDSKEAKSDADVMSKGVKRVDNTDALSKKTSYLSLYRYSDWKDISMVLLGLAASLVHGAITPIFAILLGGITNAFTNPATIQSTVNALCVWFLILGGVTFFATYFQTWCFTWSGERQANRIRRLYFRGVLRQNIAWYDMNDSGVMTSRVASDVLLVQDAISEQAGTFLQYMSQFIVGIIVGLVKGWQMTLVVLALIPPLMLGGIFIGRFMSRFAARAQQSQSAAGSIAEEVIGSVRTVMAFGGEYVEIERYSNALAVARKASGSKSQIQAFGLGLVFFVAFGAFGLAFWYGSYLVANGTMQAGDVLTVFFSVVIGATGLGQAAPSIGAFSQGSGAATHIFEVIERKPEIDVLSPEGRKLGEDFKADIKFEQIYFNYPSRPDIPILRGLDLDMKSGQTIALVGLSGSGKSTIVQLLERFYDPNQGRITLEGVDTRDLNIQWLRSQIAIVSQEPVLFATTIAQNIALGSLSDNVSKEEIEEAAKMANAYQFITSLPQGFNTLVGERGVQLSGGQKQRIAIARALIKKPKILLLDEATSALDSGSEKVVQDALDRARKGRTTIVIAHRLSTIRDADQICVMVKGQLVEQGDHASLMKAGGLYAELIAAQAVRGAEEVQEKITGDEADEELKKKIVPEAPKEEEEEEEEVVNQADGTKKKVKTKKRKLNEAELKQAKNALSRAFYMQRPEALMIFVGLIGAAGHGAILPLFTLIFARMLGILVELNIPTYDQNDLKNQADFWSGMFVVIATGAGIFNYMQSACLNISGDRLVERLRAKLFSSILKQDLGWFDHPDNGVGRLTTKLASDAILVESATGLRWGIFTEIVASLVTGLIVALTASWKIALVTLACFPLLFMGGVARTRMRAGFSGKTKKAFESAGQLASQCVSSIRTVAGLGKELTFMEQYSKLVDDASGTLLGGVGSAMGYAISELFSMPIWALAFWYGAQLVTAGEINFSQLFTALMAIIFGGFSIGRLTAVAPNIGKAQIAAKDIFDIIDHVPKIDTLAEKGEPITNVAGNVEFKDLEFAYPLRPDVTVLTKLSLSVPAGKTVALVGQSGCGKSTLIGLLERFYEQKAGSVLVDGKDISDINIHSLRQHLGLVSQEPVLFARSIIDNIKYGCPDATDEDVMKVAQEANIHTFVQSLPDGYNTFVGEKGSQLSGGQKQRVAIARALLRQPKILLLDEATSALDSESEKLVQAALETAMKGRTTILIAHRLSTVVAADVIAVVHKGEVVEQGTHDELLALRGKYAELVHTQVKL